MQSKTDEIRQKLHATHYMEENITRKFIRISHHFADYLNKYKKMPILGSIFYGMAYIVNAMAELAEPHPSSTTAKKISATALIIAIVTLSAAFLLALFINPFVGAFLGTAIASVSVFIKAKKLIEHVIEQMQVGYKEKQAQELWGKREEQINKLVQTIHLFEQSNIPDEQHFLSDNIHKLQRMILKTDQKISQIKLLREMPEDIHWIEGKKFIQRFIEFTINMGSFTLSIPTLLSAISVTFAVACFVFSTTFFYVTLALSAGFLAFGLFKWGVAQAEKNTTAMETHHEAAVHMECILEDALLKHSVEHHSDYDWINQSYHKATDLLSDGIVFRCVENFDTDAEMELEREPNNEDDFFLKMVAHNLDITMRQRHNQDIMPMESGCRLI